MSTERLFAIFSIDEINKIDFAFVLDTSPDTLRRSVDGSKTLVKWDVPEYDPTPHEEVDAETEEIRLIVPERSPQHPEFISQLTSLEGIYSHSEILDILNSPEWTIDIGDL